jgi:hypothetical protein
MDRKDVDEIIDEAVRKALVIFLAEGVNAHSGKHRVKDEDGSISAGNGVVGATDDSAAPEPPKTLKPTSQQPTTQIGATTPADNTAICYCRSCSGIRQSLNSMDPRQDKQQAVFQDHIRNKLAGSLADMAAAHSRTIDHDPKAGAATEFLDAFDWYSQLFGAVTAISTLGAGFTFTILFSEIQVPRGVSVGRADAVVQYIRTCLSAAWMLFVFSVGLSIFATLINRKMRGELKKSLEVSRKAGKSRQSIWVIVYRMSVNWFTLLTQLMPIGAFLASAEALRQYEFAIGVVSLIGTSATGLILFFVWASQSVRRFENCSQCPDANVHGRPAVRWLSRRVISQA